MLLVYLGTFCFDLVLCVLGMNLSFTETLNRKCQPFFHFIPEISADQRMANCLHSHNGQKEITEKTKHEYFDVLTICSGEVISLGP